MTTQLRQLADRLERYGLIARSTVLDSIKVRNPVARLDDIIQCADSGYVTASGYEIGEAGDEAQTADRIAFLLGVPLCILNRDLPVGTSAPALRNVISPRTQKDPPNGPGDAF